MLPYPIYGFYRSPNQIYWLSKSWLSGGLATLLFPLASHLTHNMHLTYRRSNRSYWGRAFALSLWKLLMCQIHLCSTATSFYKHAIPLREQSFIACCSWTWVSSLHALTYSVRRRSPSSLLRRPSRRTLLDCLKRWEEDHVGECKCDDNNTRTWFYRH